MAETDHNDFFRRYADAYNRSLGDRVDTTAIRSFFAETVLALATGGTVNAAANDESMDALLQQMYSFHKAIGTRRMALDHVEVAALAEGHDRVRVFYRAEYQKKDGSRLTIPFDVLYLVQRRDQGPKIFAFVAGDEMALYRQHGLVDDKGNPP